MRKLNLLILSFAMLSVSCFAFSKNKIAEQIPDWVNNPYSVYDSEKYFASVGEDESRQKAEVNAVQNIASLFGQDIDLVTTASQHMESKQSEENITTEEWKKINLEIIKRVNQKDIFGIEIKEYWLDEKRNVWYVVAVIDKAHASEIYKGVIEKNNEEINVAQNNAAEKKSMLEKYLYYKFAKNIAEKNDVHIKRLSVINQDMGKILQDKSFSSEELLGKMKETASSAPVFININGDEKGIIKAALVSVLSEEGFITTEDNSSSYVLSGSAYFTVSENSTGKITFCKYSFECGIDDSITTLKLFTYSTSGREGSGDASGAKQRSVKKIQNGILEEYPLVFEKEIEK